MVAEGSASEFDRQSVVEYMTTGGVGVATSSSQATLTPPTKPDHSEEG
jgi:hypothetical protein